MDSQNFCRYFMMKYTEQKGLTYIDNFADPINASESIQTGVCALLELVKKYATIHADWLTAFLKRRANGYVGCLHFEKMEEQYKFPSESLIDKCILIFLSYGEMYTTVLKVKVYPFMAQDYVVYCCYTFDQLFFAEILKLGGLNIFEDLNRLKSSLYDYQRERQIGKRVRKK